MIFISLMMAVCSGLLMAVQSPTNSTLSKYIGNMEATTVSFAGGSAILGAAVLIAGNGDMSNLSQVPWWQYLGGPYGVLVVFIITLAVPLLGIALTLTITMLGQIIMAMIIDGFGLFLTEAVPVSPVRILGCLVFAAGVIFVYRGKKKQEFTASGENDTKKRETVKSFIIAAVTFLSGIGSAIQSPTNVALSGHIGKVEATFMSFVTGTILAAMLMIVIRIGHSRSDSEQDFKEKRNAGFKDVKFWMIIGGLYGAVAIFFNIVATPYLGVALLIAAIMLGQLFGGMLIDSMGWLGVQKIKMNSFRVIGVVIIAAGVGIITLARILA